MFLSKCFNGKYIWVNNSIKEDFISFSNPSRKLEKEISLLFTWLLSTKMAKNMQLKPFLKKELTVKIKENSL
jgi:hypothetical protein